MDRWGNPPVLHLQEACMNWRSDPPNLWTAAYRIIMMVLLIGMYIWLAQTHGEHSMVGALIRWLIGAEP
jgi:hypothetical protein